MTVDRISELPLHILDQIISLLSLKEAARTSGLSSCWKNFWKHSLCLNLDAGSVLVDKLRGSSSWKKSMEIEGPKYVEWVDSIIQAHESPKLKEFKIRFPLDSTYSKDINRWLEFAFSRRVERLELDVKQSNYYSICKPKIEPPLKLVNCKSLKALYFNSVHVSAGVIQLFLRNCPLLEELAVHESYDLWKLDVSGTSLALKHLNLCTCYNLKVLKVSAPHLISLKVPTTEGLLLENIPKVAEVSVACPYVRELISAMPCCFSQLEVLSLFKFVGEESELCNFPDMPKLKKLLIEYFGEGNLITLLAALIRASPQLEELALESCCFKHLTKGGKINNPTKFPHRHLKVFKFRSKCSPFNPSDGDTGSVVAELVDWISRNCSVLEKIIMDPSTGESATDKYYETERKMYAKQVLKPLVPRHVKLVIL